MSVIPLLLQKKKHLGTLLNLSDLPESWVKKEGDSFYLQSKYNDSYDIITAIEVSQSNNITTLNSIGLAVNEASLPLSHFTPTELIASGEFIGPITIKDRQFIGANHTYNGLATCETKSVAVTVDGQPLTVDSTVKGKVVVITVVNDLFDTITLTESNQDVIIEETVVYTVVGNNVEVNLSHLYKIACIPRTYYGMQVIPYTIALWDIFFAHSNAGLVDLATGLNSGAIYAYPNVEKSVICTADKSRCISMWMDLASGLGFDREHKFYSAGDPAMFTSGAFGKTYHYLINQVNSGTVQVDETRTWHGVYTVFDNTKVTIVDSDLYFIYKKRIGNYYYLVIDVNGAVTETVNIPEISKKKLFIDSYDSTLTIDTADSANGNIVITATGAGNAYIRLSDSVLPFLSYPYCTIEDAARTKIDLYFSEELNDTLPDVSAFTATNKTISGIAIDATKKIVTLTVSAAFSSVDKTLVTYTVPVSNPLKSLSNKNVEAFSKIAKNNIVESLGNEIISNGEFADATDWTAANSWSIADGKATFNDVTNLSVLSQISTDNQLTILANTNYKLSFQISSAGNAVIDIYNAAVGVVYITKATYANGTHTRYFKTGGTVVAAGIALRAYTEGGAFDLDNVTLKKVNL